MIALGADGARAGWVVCVLDDGVVAAMAVVQTLAEAVERWAPDRLGVDMPVGLLDQPIRDAEVAARALLPGRTSTVFGVPCRQLVDAWVAGSVTTHAQATALQVEVTGKGLSIQSWGLVPRIAEVDVLLATRPDLLEVHPETAFATIIGSPLPRKTCWEGVARRREVLAALGVDPPASFEGSASIAPDDALDAAVVAWVAAGDDDALSSHPASPVQADRGRPIAMTVRQAR